MSSVPNDVSYNRLYYYPLFKLVNVKIKCTYDYLINILQFFFSKNVYIQFQIRVFSQGCKGIIIEICLT